MGSNMSYTIDFFELMFLAESVIPPATIARSMCFDDFSERHYHNMNNYQREQFMNHVMKCRNFDLENEQCRHFFARFNPLNQYNVTTFHNGKSEVHICYFYNDNYHTAKNRYASKEYIKEVVRIHDNEKIKL